jgi:hypothetical protein
MWINFGARVSFSIKIYVGGINAASGEKLGELKTSSQDQHRQNGKLQQDYIVVPQQKWLDGIATCTGEVRQFVAMAKGSGYSVEAQLTGQDVVGGIQFEVTPSRHKCRVMPPRVPWPLPVGDINVAVKTLTMNCGRLVELQTCR